MSDLLMSWNMDLFEGDLVTTQNKGDLDNDDGLTTAVMISIFTDRRSRDDDNLIDVNNNDRRGWWGDLLNPDPVDDEIGSRVWLFTERAKTLEQTIVDTNEALKECLQWLIDDGVASTINTNVERVGNNLYFSVEIKKIDGEKNTYSVKFDSNWNAQFNIVS